MLIKHTLAPNICKRRSTDGSPFPTWMVCLLPGGMRLLRTSKSPSELMESKGQVTSLETVVSALEGEMSSMEAAMANGSEKLLNANER